MKHLPRRCTTARFVSFIYRGIHFAVVQRRDFSLFYIQRHLLRRCTTAKFQSLLYTAAITSPLYNGEISVSFIYRGIYFAVVQRRDFSLFYIQRHSFRRCTTARFQSLLYTEAFTSPLYNGEISVSFIYRGIHFAVVQRRDFSLFYIQRHLLRRCTTARFQSPLYTGAFTSLLYNGEISVSFIYRGIYFAVVQRRDISLFYIQRHLLRRCTTARFQSLLYTEAFTSPLYNGEISVSFIYRGIHFAVVQRRDFSLFYIQRHSFRRCTTARFQSLLYTEAFTSPLYNGEISICNIYRGVDFAVVQRRGFDL